MPNLKLNAITPKHIPSSKEYADAMKRAVQKSANLAKRDLESTVKTWTHKPTFDVVIEQSGGDYSVTTGTNDKIFGYVDEGTRAHTIKPKRSRFLRFAGGSYRAKTRPNVIGSSRGGSSGSPVFAQEVHHPGFKGRGFIVLVNRRRQKTIEQEISQAIAKIARKQG